MKIRNLLLLEPTLSWDFYFLSAFTFHIFVFPLPLLGLTRARRRWKKEDGRGRGNLDWPKLNQETENSAWPIGSSTLPVFFFHTHILAGKREKPAKRSVYESED